MKFEKSYLDKTFITRTLKNFDIFNNDDLGSMSTQLINSLLGLIVIPKDLNMSIGEVEEKEIFASIKPYIIFTSCKPHNREGKFNEFLRHLRNGVSHGYIYFTEENKTIKNIRICDRKNKETDRKVKPSLTVDEIEVYQK